MDPSEGASSTEESGPSGPGVVVENAWFLKLPEWKPERDNPSGLLEESSFSIMFPEYREKYLRECWPKVVDALAAYDLKAELNVLESTMLVKTTRKTKDPYIIIKARDLIKLLGRSVPYEHAIKVLEDDIDSEIIRIGNLVRNRERFVKRRQRLLGPNGTTLKSIELLTQCYVLVQGTTVAAVGPYQGLKQVRKIVIDNMNNVHPMYNIKSLLIKRQLMKDPTKKNENWEPYLPKYEHKNLSKRKQPHKKREKKPYTPFPPEQPESKLDKQIASGEYFLTPKERKKRKMLEQREKSAENQIKREEKRKKAFKAPNEAKIEQKKVASQANQATATSALDVEKLKKKIAEDAKPKKKKRKLSN